MATILQYLQCQQNQLRLQKSNHSKVKALDQSQTSQLHHGDC